MVSCVETLVTAMTKQLGPSVHTGCQGIAQTTGMEVDLSALINPLNGLITLSKDCEIFAEDGRPSELTECQDTTVAISESANQNILAGQATTGLLTQSGGYDTLSYNFRSQKEMKSCRKKTVTKIWEKLIGKVPRQTSSKPQVREPDRKYRRIIVVHPTRRKVCYFQHAASQMYLKIADDCSTMVFAPLNDISAATFRRCQFGGYSQANREHLIIMSFSAFSNCKPSMLYLSANTTGSSIEIEEHEQRLPDTMDTVDGCTDNRTFVHHYAASGLSIFESTEFPNNYLCNNDGTLDLKYVRQDKVNQDDDIQFKIYYPSECIM